MAIDPREQWASVEISETLVGREAGGSARMRADELRRLDPLGTLLHRLVGEHPDGRAWRKGARGERVAAWWLGRLGDGWHVFNDIPVGERGANIDHLVVGPGGVCTINAKNLNGKVWVGPSTLLVNGHQTDYLRNATLEAKRAASHLSAAVGHAVQVQAALAIMAEDITIKERPNDVVVARPRGVKNWLLAQRHVLGPSEVTAIAAAAAKPGTWQRRPPSPTAPVCSCGAEMVVRTRRSDGNRFLGCSRFPACRHTRELAERPQ
jgi:hypothetical protein